MKKRKLLALFLVFALCLSLFTACGEAKEEKSKDVSLEEVKEDSATAAKSETKEASKAEEPKEETKEESKEESKAEEAPEEAKSEEPAAEEPAPAAEPAEDVTAESLLQGYIDHVDEIQSMAFSMALQADIDMELFGEENAMKMSMVVNYESYGDDAYMTGKMESDAYGETESDIVEQYIMKEGDKYVSYSYDENDNSWSKQESDQPSISRDLIPHVDVSSFDLTEENGQYKISGTVEIAKMLETMGETFGSLFDGLLGTGSEGIVGDAFVEYYFDKSTKELAAVHIDMADAIEETFSAMLTAMLSMSGLEEEGAEASEETPDYSSLLKIEVGEFAINLDDILINQGTEIVLPDEAKDAATETASTEESSSEEEKELSVELAETFEFKDEYKDFTFNGNEYTVDTVKISDFLKDNDLTLEEEDQEKMVPAGDFDYASVYLNDNYDGITFFVENTSDKEQPVTECKLYSVGFNIYSDSSIDYSIAGIKAGSTLDDVIAVLGNPTYGYESEYIKSYSWQDSDNWSSLSFGFDGESGMLNNCSISL